MVFRILPTEFRAKARAEGLCGKRALHPLPYPMDPNDLWSFFWGYNLRLKRGVTSACVRSGERFQKGV